MLTNNTLPMEETIKIIDDSSTSFAQNSASRIVCHVCQKRFAQYTCPRCNTRYCSIHCYKGHGRRCVDSFMRDNAIGEMQQIRSNDISRQKMMNILKRCYSEQEIDIMGSHGPTISEELAQKVLSGQEIRMEELCCSDKKLFQKAISSGELGRMMKPWKPWWSNPDSRDISLSKDGTRLIKPLPVEPTDNEEAEGGSPGPPPAPDSPLRPTRALTSARPSPFLPVHLVDILYSYCFTLRLYNGDWQCDAPGSSATVFRLSSVLGEKGRPETVGEAVFKCLERTCSLEWRGAGGVGFGASVVEDVARVVGMGVGALVCSLCEMEKMLARGGGGRRRNRDGERKVYFIMCWVWEQPCERWTSLASLVSGERESVLSYYRKGKPCIGGTRQQGRRECFIEEIK